MEIENTHGFWGLDILYKIKITTMKKIKYTIAIIVLFLFAGMNTTSAQKAEKDQYTVMVDGLGCPFCAYGLEKKFKELKGVKGVKIDMETGQFDFTFPSDKPLSVEQVENQVDAAGYTAVKTQITRADGTVEKSVEKLKTLDENALVTEEIYVFGNCGMCKARIHKAGNSIESVASVDWNIDSKMLKVTYDSSKISIAEIEEKMAEVGHDTHNEKTASDVYEALPGCCQYERKN